MNTGRYTYTMDNCKWPWERYHFWQIYPKIANRQNLLLTDISSQTEPSMNKFKLMYVLLTDHIQ